MNEPEKCPMCKRFLRKELTIFIGVKNVCPEHGELKDIHKRIRKYNDFKFRNLTKLERLDI